MSETAAPKGSAVRVSPGAPPARWEVRVPGSKSITNRALLLAGVAAGQSRLINPLLADDTRVMADAVRVLGATVVTRRRARGAESVVTGIGGAPRGGGELWSGMAGTAGRFMVAMVAAGSGRYVIDADPQLRRRPMGPVLAALRSQGAAIEGEAFPLTVTSDGLTGGPIEVDASVSSQFLSALVMAAPLARAPTTLEFETLVSRPYLTLTLDVMRAFGVQVDDAPGSLRVSPQDYRATELEIEPDASTASYFLAAAVLTATTVRIPGIDLDATAQGDLELVGHLERMGATVTARNPLELTGPRRLRGVHVNMGDSTDVFMTLACVAPFADAPTTIEGIGHARVKESDRIDATAANLRRLGLEVEEGPDFLRIHPGEPVTTRLPSYEDHRIAMAFSLIGTRVPVIIEHPEVVAKTCPEFFELWPLTGAVVQSA